MTPDLATQPSSSPGQVHRVLPFLCNLPVKATTTVRVITPPPHTSRASPPVPKLTGCHSPLFQRRMLNESNRDGKQKETTGLQSLFIFAIKVT